MSKPTPTEYVAVTRKRSMAPPIWHQLDLFTGKTVCGWTGPFAERLRVESDDPADRPTRMCAACGSILIGMPGGPEVTMRQWRGESL